MFEQSRPETFSITGILVEEKINASEQATERLVFAYLVSFFLATQIQPQKHPQSSQFSEFPGNIHHLGNEKGLEPENVP